MSKFAVVVFADESAVEEGARALQALHADGSVTVYARAIARREEDGAVAVVQAPEPGPLGLGVAALLEGLAGLFGGLVGAGGGRRRDYLHAEASDELLELVAQTLHPGSFALVAEVSEEWTAPIDTRVEALGGTVVREWRDDFIDEVMERRAARLAAAGGGAGAQAELVEAAGQARERLAHTRAELAAKLRILEAQAAGAGDEARARVERRRAALREAFATREQKLTRAVELAQQALQA